MKRETAIVTPQSILLELLEQAEGQVVPGGRLLQSLMDATRRGKILSTASPSAAALPVTISKLREAGFAIETVRGKGYKLVK